VSTSSRKHMLTAVAVASDSRGKGLIAFLKQKLPSIFTVAGDFQTGANISTLFQIIRRTTRNFNKQLSGHRTIVVINGGICNITSRSHFNCGVQVHFETKEGRIEKLKKDLDEITTYCKDRGYIPIFTTVIGADLIKSRDDYLNKGWLKTSRFSTAQLLEQQERLNQTLEEVNNIILSGRHNNIHGVCNLHRDSELRAHTTKGRRARKIKTQVLDSSLLYDGVHYVPSLQTKTYDKVAAGIVGYLEHLEHLEQKETQPKSKALPSVPTKAQAKGKRRRKRTRGKKRHPGVAKSSETTSSSKSQEEGPDSQSSQTEEDETWQFKRKRTGINS
jgi:hypothetical protein